MNKEGLGMMPVWHVIEIKAVGLGNPERRKIGRQCKKKVRQTDCAKWQTELSKKL